MTKIKMLKSLIGTPPYRKGATYEVDSKTATNWAKKGLCEVIEASKRPMKKKQARK